MVCTVTGGSQGRTENIRLAFKQSHWIFGSKSFYRSKAFFLQVRNAKKMGLVGLTEWTIFMNAHDTFSARTTRGII